MIYDKKSPYIYISTYHYNYLIYYIIEKQKCDEQKPM